VEDIVQFLAGFRGAGAEPRTQGPLEPKERVYSVGTVTKKAPESKRSNRLAVNSHRSENCHVVEMAKFGKDFPEIVC
jgi:hypothetical protein